MRLARTVFFALKLVWGVGTLIVRTSELDAVALCGTVFFFSLVDFPAFFLYFRFLCQSCGSGYLAGVRLFSILTRVLEILFLHFFVNFWKKREIVCRLVLST